MKTDSVIKILFVENSVEDAEQIITLLRNAGIAVRPARAATAEQFEAALGELGPDLVLFNPAVTTLPLRSVDLLRGRCPRGTHCNARVT